MWQTKFHYNQVFDITPMTVLALPPKKIFTEESPVFLGLHAALPFVLCTVPECTLNVKFDNSTSTFLNIRMKANINILFLF